MIHTLTLIYVTSRVKVKKVIFDIRLQKIEFIFDVKQQYRYERIKFEFIVIVFKYVKLNTKLFVLKNDQNTSTTLCIQMISVALMKGLYYVLLAGKVFRDLELLDIWYV